MRRTIKIILTMGLLGSTMACAQKQAEGYSVVDAATFADDIKADSTAYILDVRTPDEFAEGHIAGAHNLDWLNQETFKAGVSELPKTETIYVYCRSGRRSAEAAQYLSASGYKVVDLDGGYLAWRKYAM